MSSTLVETVSINYEDFNESFLTCGTCLCTYDGGEHTPKLLPCSHTVCLHCLTRIAASQTRDTGSFRCPICRELITVPRGGVAALPPSFLVNQLLDLMARQRREVVPQCSTHPGRELLFCETCDCVFCAQCAGGPHSDTPCDHTVVPFSIALKRMSEILLYRANECLSKLSTAREAVAGELRRLETAATAAEDAVNRHFAELRAALDRRHSELRSAAAAAAAHKRKLLDEQLKLIDAEKAKVESECAGLQQQVEVRAVSGRAAALGERLAGAAGLAEPRENAFLAADFAHNDAPARLADALQVLGRVRTSTTFPGLCTLELEGTAVAGLEMSVLLRTVDYHGEARSTGGDPVSAQATADDAPLPCTVTDLDDGTYRITMRPTTAGNVSVQVCVFSRAVRDSPLRADVASHNEPLLCWGSRGSGKDQLSQPVALARCPKKGAVYVLDAGNSRVKVLDDETFTFRSHIINDGLSGRSCTGLAVTSRGLAAVNWRARRLTELTAGGDTLRTLEHAALAEPVACAACETTGRVAVADNGARCVFVFDESGRLEFEVGGYELGLVGGLCLSPDLLVVADTSIHIYNSKGEAVSTIAPIPKGRGTYGGIALESSSRLVALRCERARTALLVLEASGRELARSDLAPRVRRPGGVALLDGRRVVVADLAADCLRVYRYW